MPVDPHTVTEAAVGALVVAKGVWDALGGKRRDRRHGNAFETFKSEITAEFAAFRLELQEVRSFVVGPDGKNGVRGDTQKLERRVEGLEERERDRLHGTYDRRGGP